MSVVPQKKNRLEGRKLWFFFTAVAGLLTGVIFFVIASQVTATTKYYVLNSDIPARTQITEAVVQEVVTSTGGQPPTSLSESDIISGQLYSKYALDFGDILTPSNVDFIEPIDTGLPDGFVTGTFSVPASMAAGGKIARGNYIDLITVVTDSQTGELSAGYTLQHALVVDATIDLDSAAGAEATASVDESGDTIAPAAETSSIRNGIPTMYTLGLNQRDAAKLALSITNSQIYVVLSAEQESGVAISDTDITITIDDIRGMISDSGEGTDNKFGLGQTEEEKQAAIDKAAAEAEADKAAATDEPTSDSEVPVTSDEPTEAPVEESTDSSK